MTYLFSTNVEVSCSDGCVGNFWIYRTRQTHVVWLNLKHSLPDFKHEKSFSIISTAKTYRNAIFWLPHNSKILEGFLEPKSNHDWMNYLRLEKIRNETVKFSPAFQPRLWQFCTISFPYRSRNSLQNTNRLKFRR